jgi:tRNA threonylcarbamoyladenosine biosynthesis protein TsaE
MSKVLLPRPKVSSHHCRYRPCLHPSRSNDRPATLSPAGRSCLTALTRCLYSLVVAVRIVDTSDPAETESLGAELAGHLRDGDVVLVRGELGSGKTTLVRGAAHALGVTDPVTSPSFSIGHRYRAGERLTVSHLDLYRIAGLEHEDPSLLGDYLGAGRIAFIEWPQEDAREFSSARLRISLAHRGEDERRIEVVEA